MVEGQGWHGDTPGHEKAALKGRAGKAMNKPMKGKVIEVKEGFEIGEVLYGFCNGYFGRDSYENKRVEAFGEDWIVCRDEGGHIHFATFDSNKPIPTRLPARKEDGYISFWEMVEKWRNPVQD